MCRFNTGKYITTLSSIWMLLAFVFVVSATADQGTGAVDLEAGETAQPKTAKPKPAGEFLFSTGVSSEGSRSDITVGVEYERRFNSSLGIGAVAEYGVGDLDIRRLTLPATYHKGRWKFQAAPGVQDSYRGLDFVMRFGAGYQFDFNGWSLIPDMKFDLVDEKGVAAFGLNFRFGSGYGGGH